jgi:hypothetical protein
MEISIYRTKKLGFIGGLLAYRGWNIDKTLKRHFLVRNHVDWCINHTIYYTIK